MKTVIYSAIIGGYDRPKPLPLGLDVPAIMLTDSEETAEQAREAGWRTSLVRATPGWSPMMQYKWYKLHPHRVLPSTDVSLWVDGSITILEADYGARCLAALGDDDWAMTPHPVRSCIYDEAAVSSTLGWRYDPVKIQQQADYYRSIGHPAQWGLFATGANARRHTDHVRELCDHWWYENETRTHQDQISLPVLTRLMSNVVRWNTNLPWHQWWHLGEHEWTGGVNR